MLVLTGSAERPVLGCFEHVTRSVMNILIGDQQLLKEESTARTSLVGYRLLSCEVCVEL